MLVLIKSAHDTPEARRAVKLAREMAADIVLLQNAVCLAEKDRLEGFCGTAHAVEEDLKLRGVAVIEKGVRPIDYDQLVDLVTEDGNIVGMF